MSKLASVLGALAVALLLAACGGASGSPAGGGGGASLPAGFPSEFPVYSGANVSAANSPRSGQFDVSWTTSGKGGQLFSYYQARLATGDWTVQVTAGDTTHGGLIEFNRKSDPNSAGRSSWPMGEST